MTIDINSLTLGQLKEIAQLASGMCNVGDKSHDVFGKVKAGEKVFIATVTRYYIGRVVDVGHDWITLEESGWCAQTGEFTDFLEKGTMRRFQPSVLPWQMLGRGAIVEVSPWVHELPRKKVDT